MKQNKYDDPAFFDKYSKMSRSVHGLSAGGEWYAFRALLPDLQQKHLLDLGCGYGWHCRYAREQQARSVVGVDLSEKMLAQAKAMTDDPAIEYQRSAMEDIDFPASSFDVVISSLALHYIEHYDLVCKKVHHFLVAGGVFIFSVEHPIFTARAEQQWHLGPQGERLHWPVDNYAEEGVRHTQWLADNVTKYHRTVAAYVNTLIESGFSITKLLEPEPSAEMLLEHPHFRDDCRRPPFLLLAALRL